MLIGLLMYLIGVGTGVGIGAIAIFIGQDLMDRRVK